MEKKQKRRGKRKNKKKKKKLEIKWKKVHGWKDRAFEYHQRKFKGQFQKSSSEDYFSQLHDFNFPLDEVQRNRDRAISPLSALSFQNLIVRHLQNKRKKFLHFKFLRFFLALKAASSLKFSLHFVGARVGKDKVEMIFIDGEGRK